MPQTRQRLTVGQEPFLVVRSFACDYSSGTTLERHHHDWHQLLHARAGAMSVHAGSHSWMIPPGKAVFIPAGCVHSVRMWGRVGMRSLLFSSTLAGLELNGECRVLSVTALLHELILRIIATPALDSRVPSHQRLLSVLLDEINAAPVEPLLLPLPLDPRALSVARHVLSNLSGGETLDQLAREYGTGRRTLERLFRNETGFSFGLWRQKVRMLDSIRLLSEGESVTNCALDNGYASVSAFIAAFKQTFGYTPGKL